MARLFAFIANRPDLGARVAEVEAALFTERAAGEPQGWGIGFYQGGELLLKRRPVDDRADIALGEALRGVRTDVAVGHVRRATVGAMSTENTHPFRYRQWLFAHTGTVAGFPAMRERLAESIPQFLRRNVRGDTDSELLFHLFLSFLHDAGKLQDAQPAPSDVRVALRSSIALVDRLSQEEGSEPKGMNLVVTDGEHVYAVHSASRMALRVYRGRGDLDEIALGEAASRTRTSDADAARLCLLVSDYDEGTAIERFTEIENRSILTLTRDVDPIIEPLDTRLRAPPRRLRPTRGGGFSGHGRLAGAAT